MKSLRFLSMLGVAALAFAIPVTAGATVKKEGSWPVVDKKVDLEFEGKPSEGLKKLAKEADWSLVVANGVAIDERGDIQVDVDDQPADVVLEALFIGHDVVAHRNGTLITLRPGSVAPGASPANVATVSAPLLPTVRGEDRSVFGGDLVIAKDEVVHTVTLAGGSLEVEGTVTGDVVVAGGSAKIRSGGHVVGNATAVGGTLKVEKDGRVDGVAGIAGGVLTRENGAIIGGRVFDDAHPGNLNLNDDEDGAKTDVTTTEKGGGSRLSTAVHAFGESMTKMALLFVLGCVFLALLTPRMEKAQTEIASRPMRSFAVGLVATLVGSIGAAILVTVLCITVIGIPVAMIGVLLAVLAVYGAVASVLTTFGAAVSGHRTQNPYLHLLVGCCAFLVLSSIPWLGGFVTFAVAMIAIGVLVTTRAGGLLERGRKAPMTGLV